MVQCKNYLRQCNIKPAIFDKNHINQQLNSLRNITKLGNSRVKSGFLGKKKPPEGGFSTTGGRGGIRTRGRLLTYARFPGV
jgi:hypothetical protein